MIDINASMGIIQLKKIERNWKQRKKIFQLYKSKLKKLPIYFQKINLKNVRHGYHLILIVIDKNKTNKKRDQLISYLRKNKIGTGVNYRTVTDMSIYRKKYKWSDKTCKNSKYLGDNTLSLPLYPNLKIKEVNYICGKIIQFFEV